MSNDLDPNEEWQRDYNQLRTNPDYISPVEQGRATQNFLRDNLDRRRQRAERTHLIRPTRGPTRGPIRGPTRIYQGPTRGHQRAPRRNDPYQREPERPVRGLAYQIHDFSKKIDMDKLCIFLSKIISVPLLRDYKQNIISFIKNILKEIIETSESERYMNDLETINNRIVNINLDEKLKTAIIYSLIFVLHQPLAFKQLYIQAFFMDCLEAYNRTSRSSRQDTLSCPKGVVERLITSMMAGIVSNPDNENYIQLANILTAKSIDQRIKEFGEKWLKDNSTPKSKEEEPSFEKMRNALLNEFEDREKVEMYLESYKDFPWSDFEAGVKRKARKRRKTHKMSKRRKSYKSKRFRTRRI